MNNEEGQRPHEAKADKQVHKPYKLRLPGFINEAEVGLGDVVKRTTSYIGIKPCGGCERRAAALNRWFVFTGRRPN